MLALSSSRWLDDERTEVRETCAFSCNTSVTLLPASQKLHLVKVQFPLWHASCCIYSHRLCLVTADGAIERLSTCESPIKNNQTMNIGDKANIRMAREIKMMTEAPPPGVIAWPSESNMNQMTAQLRV